MKKLLSLLFLMTMAGNAWGLTVSSTPLTSVSDGDLVVWGTNTSNCIIEFSGDWGKTGNSKSPWIVFTVESCDKGFYLKYTDGTNGIKYVYSSADKKITGDSMNKTLFTITDKGKDHTSILYNESTGYYTYNSSGIRPYKSTAYTDAHLYAVIPSFTAATPLTLAAQSGNNYYATFSSDKVVFIPKKNAQVMKANVEGENITFTPLDEAEATISEQEISGYYVPANTGVLVKSTSNSVAYYTVENKTVASLSDNMLYPASKAKTDFSGCLFYKLAYASADKDALGFYYGAAYGAAFDSRSGSAYLAVPTTQGSAKTGWIFDWNDDTASVSSLQNEKAVDAPFVYNLIGQRVNANTKGIMIINGRKYINK